MCHFGQLDMLSPRHPSGLRRLHERVGLGPQAHEPGGPRPGSLTREALEYIGVGSKVARAARARKPCGVRAAVGGAQRDQSVDLVGGLDIEERQSGNQPTHAVRDDVDALFRPQAIDLDHFREGLNQAISERSQGTLGQTE